MSVKLPIKMLNTVSGTLPVEKMKTNFESLFTDVLVKKGITLYNERTQQMLTQEDKKTVDAESLKILQRKIQKQYAPHTALGEDSFLWITPNMHDAKEMEVLLKLKEKANYPILFNQKNSDIDYIMSVQDIDLASTISECKQLMDAYNLSWPEAVALGTLTKDKVYEITKYKNMDKKSLIEYIDRINVNHKNTNIFYATREAKRIMDSFKHIATALERTPKQETLLVQNNYRCGETFINPNLHIGQVVTPVDYIKIPLKNTNHLIRMAERFENDLVTLSQMLGGDLEKLEQKLSMALMCDKKDLKQALARAFEKNTDRNPDAYTKLFVLRDSHMPILQDFADKDVPLVGMLPKDKKIQITDMILFPTADLGENAEEIKKLLTQYKNNEIDTLPDTCWSNIDYICEGRILQDGEEPSLEQKKPNIILDRQQALALIASKKEKIEKEKAFLDQTNEYVQQSKENETLNRENSVRRLFHNVVEKKEVYDTETDSIFSSSNNNPDKNTLNAVSTDKIKSSKDRDRENGVKNLLHKVVEIIKRRNIDDFNIFSNTFDKDADENDASKTSTETFRF